MAVFKNDIFPELSFYVNDQQHKFSSGSLRTNDQDVIDKVQTLTGVIRIDDPKPEPKQEKPKPTPKKLSPKKAK